VLFRSKTSGERDVYARNKTRQLFGQEDHSIDIGIYGLGSVRTLREYEIFGGFDFKNTRIQDYTLQVKEPPNPLDYENQFISKEYKLDCSWDIEHFLSEKNNSEIDFLTFGIESSSGINLYRHDFLPDKFSEKTNFANNTHQATFRSIDKPYKIVMYAQWKNRGWGNRYEKILNK
jgi:hypothetical protein